MQEPDDLVEEITDFRSLSPEGIDVKTRRVSDTKKDDERRGGRFLARFQASRTTGA